mgnify:CR=1 FL=1
MLTRMVVVVVGYGVLCESFSCGGLPRKRHLRLPGGTSSTGRCVAVSPMQKYPFLSRLLSQFVVGRLTGRLLAAPRPGLLCGYLRQLLCTSAVQAFQYPTTPNVLGSDRLGKFEAPQCDFEHWPMLPSAFEPFPRRNARKRCLKRSIWLGH